MLINHTDKYSPAMLSLKSVKSVRCTTSDGKEFHKLIALGKMNEDRHLLWLAAVKISHHCHGWCV